MGSLGLSERLPQVFRLSSDTVVKRVFGGDSTFEPYTMGLVAAQTSIPVPRVRTHFSDDRDRYIVMEYIEGDDLNTIWPKLSIWRKLWAIWTIRGYVRQLRSVQLTGPDLPGPIDAMAQWFEHKLVVSIDIAKNPYHANPVNTNLPRFDRSRPLVLTHGDIGMRNVRIGKDGKVWLLDWVFSGAYPEWFEYAGMIKYDNPTRPLPWLWVRMIPFMAGFYPRQSAFLDRIRLGLQHSFWKMTAEE